MIIRPTKKVINLSKIPATKNELDFSNMLPGEWYVDLVSLGRPGKFGLQFLHSPSYTSVVVPGRSINKALGQFKMRVENFLMRHGYTALIPHFTLDTKPEFHTSNNRSILAHMNQIKWDTSYHCTRAESLEAINYAWIEDIALSRPFHSKKYGNKYKTPKELLDELLSQLT